MYLRFLLYATIFLSCQNVTQQTDTLFSETDSIRNFNRNHSNYKNDTLKEDMFESFSSACDSLDTSINKVILFNNTTSMRESFPNIDSAWKLNDRVYFLSKDSSKYVSFGFNYGGYEDEYKEAEIGFAKKPFYKFVPQEVSNSIFYSDTLYSEMYPKFYFTVSDFEDFKTGWGIHLNLSENDFLKLMGNRKLNKNIVNNETIYYFISEDCLYEAKYVFIKGLLIVFSFGYVTP